MGIGVLTIGQVSAAVGLIEEKTQARRERLYGAKVNVGGEVVPIKRGPLGSAVLGIIAGGQVIPGLVGPAAQAEAVLLIDCRLIDLGKPVSAPAPKGVDRCSGFRGEGGRTLGNVSLSQTMPLDDPCHITILRAVGMEGVAEQSKLEVDLLVCCQEIEPISIGTPGGKDVTSEIDHHLAFLASLGGDHDDAIGCSCSVDGRGSSVL